MKQVSVLFVCLMLAMAGVAQNASVYPGNWWVGMKYNKVQLMLRGDNADFKQQQVRIQYPGVKVTGVHTAENGKYLFVDVAVQPTAKPGTVAIELTGTNKKKQAVSWPLLARRKGIGTNYARGVTSEDFIYFLMPDRFSNGDTTNDHVAGMRDQSLNREDIGARHGGDLQGIINHLDYFQRMGVTALWLTPILENDMPERTEHGYAFTDHYAIERRVGGAKMYQQLSDELHKRGMKLIQDAVYNHTGSYHFLAMDPPAKSWFHQWPSFTQTNFKEQPIFDPYASARDRSITTDGWFVPSMPDLDQTNPYVANFLIQHALWCVEMFGVDGWRIDTYIYNDLPFMNRCNKALTDEYPRMTMFGEAWVGGTANQAYFAENNINTGFKSNLQGVVDFQTLFTGIKPALTDTASGDGVQKLYNTLSNDFLYKNPMRNVVFLDNHDMSRFFSEIQEDPKRQKIGIGWLLTTRGIPQLYYGTEVLMKGFSNPDGLVRLDFPGGWEGDTRNAFTGKGLTATETAIQQYTQKMGIFRKNSSAIKTGKLMQYLPAKGLYIYFRYNAQQTVMCVMNTSGKEAAVNFSDYAERTNGFTKAVNVETGSIEHTGSALTVPAMSFTVLELKK
ncbi:glycosidase [Filimonas zeae]|uniref:Glycosyl hydrolase n=1 Tax=Filimonas zeae TaxID=1737353 RepID=A0A917MXZ1_9BACT|nr:glycoside hydrolase family 13 protein [Filimonas zeae]MDR6338530.1 glycosidase [Filimonas zeae]GGH67802.1 glycosyl hydrolase [Filimonas zeae]